MKLRLWLKNPIHFNLLVLTVIPIIFILIGVLSLFSETIQNIFFSPVYVYSYVTEKAADFFGADADAVCNTVFSLFYNYTTMFSFYFLILSGNIIVYYLHEQGMAGIYKKAEMIFYIVLMLLLIPTFIYTGVIFIDTFGLIFAVILFLPSMFLLSCGIGKTVSVKNWKKIKERK